MHTPELHNRFYTLIEEHKGILYKVSNAYTRNRDDREDLAQEILVQLWRSFPTFDFNGRCRFSTWMYRIALNVAISYCRSESARTRHVISSDERLFDIGDESTIPAGAAIPSEEILLLHQFIAGLVPLNRALVLLYLDGNSYREIADVLGISETNVATKLSRLKQIMKQEFRATTPA